MFENPLRLCQKRYSRMLEFETLILYSSQFCAFCPFVQTLVKLVRFDQVNFGIVKLVFEGF